MTSRGLTSRLTKESVSKAAVVIKLSLKSQLDDYRGGDLNNFLVFYDQPKLSLMIHTTMMEQSGATYRF